MAGPTYTFENQYEIDRLWSDVWTLLWLYPLSHSILATLAIQFQIPIFGHAFYPLFGLITFGWAISYARRLFLKNVYSIPNTLFFTVILATVAAAHPYVVFGTTDNFWPSLKWTGTDGPLFWWPSQSTHWLYAGNLLYSVAIAVALVIAIIAIISFAIYGIHSVVIDLRNRDSDRNVLTQSVIDNSNALRHRVATLAGEVDSLKKSLSQGNDWGEDNASLRRRIAHLENMRPIDQNFTEGHEEPSKFTDSNPLAAFKGL
jgi:hypothetical protein